MLLRHDGSRAGRARSPPTPPRVAHLRPYDEAEAESKLRAITSTLRAEASRTIGRDAWGALSWKERLSLVYDFKRKHPGMTWSDDEVSGSEADSDEGWSSGMPSDASDEEELGRAKVDVDRLYWEESLASRRVERRVLDLRNGYGKRDRESPAGDFWDEPDDFGVCGRRPGPGLRPPRRPHAAQFDRDSCTCEQCGKVLKTPAGKENHIRDVHSRRQRTSAQAHSGYSSSRYSGPSSSRSYDPLSERMMREMRFHRGGGDFEMKSVGWCHDHGARKPKGCDYYEMEDVRPPPAPTRAERAAQRERADFEAYERRLEEEGRERVRLEHAAERQRERDSFAAEARTDERALLQRMLESASVPDPEPLLATACDCPCLLRFDETQSWAERAAVLFAECCAEMQSRAGFFVNVDFTPYHLVTSGSTIDPRIEWVTGEIQVDAEA